MLAAIARIEANWGARTDPLCRRYYELCLIGWEAHLKQLMNRTFVHFLKPSTLIVGILCRVLAHTNASAEARGVEKYYLGYQRIRAPI